MKYIVLWYIITTVPVSSPFPKADEYTGKISYEQTLVQHLDTRSEVKYRAFDTKDEAQRFIDRAPENVKEGMKLVEVKEIVIGTEIIFGGAK